MLVLTRDIGEEVVVEGPCIVRLLGISRGQARLGFIAEKKVKIYRAELARKPKKNGDKK